MTILLQNKKTLDYVQGPARWTTDVDQARVFDTGMEAMWFCLHHDIGDMQILGKFVDTRMDFTVPVTDVRAE
jgi:hypothetical protein